MSGRRSSGQGQSSLGYLFGNNSGESGQHDNHQPKAVGISGGGQSSLGYLFGSNTLDQQSNHETKRSTSVSVPPYGTDDVVEEKPLPPPSKKDDNIQSDKSYVYHKVDAENSKDFLMTVSLFNSLLEIKLDVNL